MEILSGVVALLAILIGLLWILVPAFYRLLFVSTP